jgi:protein disulfide-isomerase
MKFPFLPLITLCSLLCGSAHAEFRIWANTSGQNVDAELVSADGDDVTFRLRSGKLTTFSMTKLSEADRAYIKKNPPVSKPAVKKEVSPAARPALSAPAVPETASLETRKAKWQTKMAKAKEEAQKTGLPILVLFTGTTWCPYCIKLENEVFSQKEFKTFANQNLVLLMLDFAPGGETTNRDQAKLKTEFGVKGFPTYFLTDAEGKQLAQGGYHNGINPDEFAKWATSHSSTKK